MFNTVFNAVDAFIQMDIVTVLFITMYDEVSSAS